MSYQDGEWVDWWNGELYDLGNEYTAITGGIIDWQYFSVSGISNKGTITKNANSITITVNGTSIAVGPANAIDLTNYTKLKCNVLSGGVNERTRLAVQPSNTIGAGDTARSEIPGAGVVTVDISSLEGLYYPSVYAWSYSGNSYVLTFDKLWLE